MPYLSGLAVSMPPANLAFDSTGKETEQEGASKVPATSVFFKSAPFPVPKGSAPAALRMRSRKYFLTGVHSCISVAVLTELATGVVLTDITNKRGHSGSLGGRIGSAPSCRR